MKQKINTKGFTISPRDDLVWSLGLSEQEFMLFFQLIRTAVWDKKHKNSFGVCFASIDFIQKNLLPLWSRGKVSHYINELIKRELIKREERGVLRIINYERYTVQGYRKLEKERQENVQSTEHNVHSTEQDVQPTRQPRPIRYKSEPEIIGKTIRKSGFRRPYIEYIKFPKETPKEI